jgi:CheY-like chemotaxis protein
MKTVLIADDLELSRVFLSILLKRHAYRVLEAEVGDEGLRIMRSERPDLAIIDLLMPRMDGFEFARAVRADQSIAQTRIIFLTANFPICEVVSLAHCLSVRHLLTESSSNAEILAAVHDALRTSIPPAVSVPHGEFHREHFRLISARLAEELESLATAFGDLFSAAPPPSMGNDAT